MIKNIASASLKLISIGLVLTTGVFWAIAGVETRPKYRDEQTLVAGTIWSQTIIPIGLMISDSADKYLDIFVNGYFILSGFLLLAVTGLLLIIGECKVMTSRISMPHKDLITGEKEPVAQSTQPCDKYDKIYFTIGVLSLLASFFTLGQFVLLFL